MRGRLRNRSQLQIPRQRLEEKFQAVVMQERCRDDSLAPCEALLPSRGRTMFRIHPLLQLASWQKKQNERGAGSPISEAGCAIGTNVRHRTAKLPSLSRLWSGSCGLDEFANEFEKWK
ncbi:Hypothetical protein NTJ_04729 [Nesidiocoris tenuis]|uniref:Uncharacterized protein n=1 Tax=Nesidiocoris tenuis TaxID=355587 RepID=A0ABN7AM10_9HEMI|nr:Hypothetical protein NTJ_04729 [Nesidiocoris tenuis]